MILKMILFFKTFIYWILSTLLLVLFFVLKGHSFGQVIYFVIFLLPVVIGTSHYVNNKLIPNFLLRKMHGLFILYSVYTIIISLYLQYLIIFIALFIFPYFQNPNISIITMNIGNLSLTLYIMVLIKLVIDIIQKLSQTENRIVSLEKNDQTNDNHHKLIIRYNRINHTIAPNHIIYIESLSDYLKLVTEDGEIITREKISKIIERLPAYFKRTHRSFIINSHKISSYNKECISLGNHIIPISRTYKIDVLNFLKGK